MDNLTVRPWPPFKRHGTTITQRITGDDMSIVDESARITNLIEIQAGSASTPVITDTIGSIKSTIYSTGDNAAIIGSNISAGTENFVVLASHYGLVTGHPSDNANSFIAGFAPFLTNTQGTATKSGMYLGDYGAGAIWDYVIHSQVGANIALYEAVNDANPSWKFGASTTENLNIQTYYDAGTQLIDFVLFQTDTAGVGANKGKFKFNVDGADIFQILDTGIFVTGTISSADLSLAGGIIQEPTAPGVLYEMALETEWTTGGLIDASFGSATTLSGEINGIWLDFGKNVTATGQSVYGFGIDMPAVTNTGAGVYEYIGYGVYGDEIIQNTAAGVNDFIGFDVELPDTTATTGNVNAYGLKVTGGTKTSGLQVGVYVSMNAATDTAVHIDQGIAQFDNNIVFGDETVDIGTTSIGLNDLHFGSGGIINFDGGDVTITHSAAKLTWGGDGAVEIDFNNHEMTNVDIDSGTIDVVNIGAGTPGTGAFTNLSANGANFRGRMAVGAADYNPSAYTDDYIIAVDNTAAARAVTISTEDEDSGSATAPRMFIIKDEKGACATNNITVSLESGGTIDGGATYVMKAKDQAITLYIDGTNAYII